MDRHEREATEVEAANTKWPKEVGQYDSMECL